MNPDRHLSSHYDYFYHLIQGDEDSAESHRQFYDEYNAVLDMPAEYYLDTIKTVFQEFALVNGTWRVSGELVRPQDITDSAMLTVEGELDDISGAGQTRAAHGLCTGIPQARRFHYDVEGAGHYGIFSGRRWRERVYPQVRDFIARFDRAAAAGTASTARKAAGAEVIGLRGSRRRARRARATAARLGPRRRPGSIIERCLPPRNPPHRPPTPSPWPRGWMTRCRRRSARVAAFPTAAATP